MSQEFDAIYTQGHLVPLEPLRLREQQRVRVHIEHVASASSEQVASRGAVTPENRSSMTLHDALAATGLLGGVENAPADLSTNPVHMEGFGESNRSAD